MPHDESQDEGSQLNPAILKWMAEEDQFDMVVHERLHRLKTATSIKRREMLEILGWLVLYRERYLAEAVKALDL
jgi:hypothetical protein